MKFGPVPIDSAEGKILGHNIAGLDGRRALRKGRALTRTDIEILRGIGRQEIYVAELEPGDIDENQAAGRIARAAAGPGIRLSTSSAGRVNFLSQRQGILRIDPAGLFWINSFDGVTLSTRPANQPLAEKELAATLKIIPYALPGETVESIESPHGQAGPAISVEELGPKKVGLIFSSATEARQRVLNDFEAPLRERIEGLGSVVERIDFVPLDEETGESDLAAILRRMEEARIDLIVLAGETAIMDRQDIAPRAVEQAGGRVECVGVPVDPGNLLMVAFLGDIPVLGAPGCARSRKTNVIDWVLPRLLVGEKLRREDLIGMSIGGLLEDTPLRPRPRTEDS
ncbi:MAG TPA: molybdopterin-binding protein [Anaerolineales bacterium]|nr:molybdopterin-binding protein [Anaerolineales bacterium]